MSSRRDFLRRVGIGAVGLSSLGLTSVVEARCCRRTVCVPTPCWCGGFGGEYGGGANIGDMTSFGIHFHTTNDDKDKEIQFYIEIKQGSGLDSDPVLGSWVGGLNELWDNGDNRDVEFPIAPFPYLRRGELYVRHVYQNPSGGDQGWEGEIWGWANVLGQGVFQVRSKTGNYKLGEHGNPHVRLFRIDR